MSLIEMTTEQKAQTMTILHTVWSWRGGAGQKTTTEGHHTRRPHQKALPEGHNRRPLSTRRPPSIRRP